MDYSSLTHIERLIRENIEAKSKLEKKYDLIDDLDKTIIELEKKNKILSYDFNKQLEISKEFMDMNAEFQKLIESKNREILFLNTSIANMKLSTVELPKQTIFTMLVEKMMNFVIGMICIFMILYMHIYMDIYI